MTALAAVVLAHADPEHLARLTNALEDVPIVVHCDARTSEETYGRMVTATRRRITFVPRRRTTLASWSLVRAELDALRAALARSDARHIAVLSGSCYPLMAMPDLLRELDAWDGRTWLHNAPMPMRDWDTPRHPDGGMWRLNRRFLVRDDQILFWRDIPLRLPIRRSLPPELEFRAGSQWKVYARSHARALLDVVDRRPDLIRFWRTTLVPDETFVASMLASRSLFGADALPACDNSAWFIDWENQQTGHPHWLGPDHFDRLRASRRGTTPTLFARKFRSSDPAVLDRIDTELRGARV